MMAVRALLAWRVACLAALLCIVRCGDDDSRTVDTSNGNQSREDGLHAAAADRTRYLLYDINPGEGFNLRRDVYIRVVNLVKSLNEEQSWKLVLPPWGPLHHWNRRDSGIPWSTFFDLASLNRLIPVIELDDFIAETGEPVIDQIYYLQGYKEGWTDGKWEEKMDIRECVNSPTYAKDEMDGLWHGWFWDHDRIVAKSFQCLSIQSEATNMKPFLTDQTQARSVFIDRAETLIHGSLSEWSQAFWTARRSIRFAKHLRDVGDDFRREYLNSTDGADRTVLADDWTECRKKHGDALGGPYLGVHLRRGDFLYAHPDQVPSIEETAKQLKDKLKKLELNRVFVGTDMVDREWTELRKLMKDIDLYRFEPSDDVLHKYKDAGVAIIDQWIMAHARYFLGTSVSTFSFRIHEEREILGFNPETTFNRLCHDNDKDCEQPTKWNVVYEKTSFDN